MQGRKKKHLLILEKNDTILFENKVKINRYFIEEYHFKKIYY